MLIHRSVLGDGEKMGRISNIRLDLSQPEVYFVNYAVFFPPQFLDYINFKKSVAGPILSGSSVTRFDSGIFTLIAGNSVGTVNATIHVTVECKHYRFLNLFWAYSSRFLSSVLLNRLFCKKLERVIILGLNYDNYIIIYI